jgi:pimeloyl-ACP methyl ester carboxylesterase
MRKDNFGRRIILSQDKARQPSTSLANKVIPWVVNSFLGLPGLAKGKTSPSEPLQAPIMGFMNQPTPPKPPLHLIRGTGVLALDALKGITQLTAATHRAISPLRFFRKGDTTPGALSGAIYRLIHSILDLSQQELDNFLIKLETLVPPQSSRSEAEDAYLAALNGVLGDHLVARNNPLAIPMTLIFQGQPLLPEQLPATLQQPGNTLILMIHGLCMNHRQWNREGHDHGIQLSKAMGQPVLYLHYNSGRHISINGKSCAEWLERLWLHLPKHTELVLVTHSMGGLVARSACHAADIAGHHWRRHLKKLVFLGTPHHGAPLEQAGHWLHRLLTVSRHTRRFASLAEVRSEGVTDLRFGNVQDSDWQGGSRFLDSTDPRTPTPLPENVACFAIAGRIHTQSGKATNTFIGDGLVGVDSALGRHRDPRFHLNLPPTNQWMGEGLNHFDLLKDPQVFSRLNGWLTT